MQKNMFWVTALLATIFFASPAHASGDYGCYPEWKLNLEWEYDGIAGCSGIAVLTPGNTQELEGYAGFLRDFRKRLPPQYKLSITGLLDWSANGDPQQLGALDDVVDEIIFQTYQGRNTIPGYDKWLTKLDNLPMPFKIGLV